MKFVLGQEGDFPEGGDLPTRYEEMKAEAIFAEKMGFDTYALSEQHFLKKACSVSAPEVFLADIAARTTKLRLRTASVVLLPFNHPIRVAERLTTLDVLSHGRVDLGTARSNNLNTLEGFGVDPAETRAMWNESLDIIIKALTHETFEHSGKYWTIPPRPLIPKPIQTPHPPILVSATSFETNFGAGKRGIGAMVGNSILGWEYAARCIEEYQKGHAEVSPAPGSYVNNCISFLAAVAHCTDDMERARKEAAAVAKGFIDLVIWLYSRLGNTTADYAYLGAIKRIEERKDDLDYVLDSAPYFMVGTPDYLIERIRRIEKLGAHEMILRIDGMGHEVNMQSIEAFGTKVMPHFKK